jgi:serine/threonine protein kinase
MSPEQARGLEVDQRTDIWSTGCILYEMLAGRPAFDGITRSDVLVAVLDREPKPVSDPAANIPEILEWVIDKALTKDREERYQTAKEMMADLRRVRRQLDNANSDGHQTVITSPSISENGPEIRPPDTDPQNGSTTPLPSGATNSSSRGFTSAEVPKSNVRKALIGTIAVLVCGAIALAFYSLVFRRTTGDGNLNAGARSRFMSSVRHN